jgi:hypothetical protein
MPATIHFAGCSVAEHVNRAIRVLAATRTDLTLLHKVIESASERHKALNDAVERRTYGRIADIRLGWQLRPVRRLSRVDCRYRLRDGCPEPW